MKNQCECSAHNDGWFRWLGTNVWLHLYIWQSGFERPCYIIGSARDVCLLQGLFTGDTTL